MAKLRSSNIEPSTATTLTLGASGDSIAVSSDSIKANTWQDVGANSLFVSNGSGTLSSVNSSLSGAVDGQEYLKMLYLEIVLVILSPVLILPMMNMCLC